MLVFCPPPGGTHLLCDPSTPLPVETGRLASWEGPGTWESRGKKMGGSGSKTAILENMIKNFKKGFIGDYVRKMTPSQLRTLCEVEWPSMGVGRPPEGTMDLSLIKAVYAIVTGKPRHPDQFPYIDSWLGIAQFSSIQFSRLVTSDSLRPHESQHARPPCPSPNPGVCSNSRPSSQ